MGLFQALVSKHERIQGGDVEVSRKAGFKGTVHEKGRAATPTKVELSLCRVGGDALTEHSDRQSLGRAPTHSVASRKASWRLHAGLQHTPVSMASVRDGKRGPSRPLAEPGQWTNGAGTV